MVSWVSLFSPGPGTAVKDMDVVGDHCVLVARTPASELVLIVVPLAQPEKAYTLQVSVLGQKTRFEFCFLSLYHLRNLPLYVFVLTVQYFAGYNIHFRPRFQSSLLGPVPSKPRNQLWQTSAMCSNS